MSSEAGSNHRARSVILLAIVSAIAAVPRVLAGLSDLITYDGYWHLFIARNLTREYRSLAHPPLFPLLLKACDAIHHSRLSYEAISIVAGTGAVFLFGRVLQKLRTNAAVPVLGALAFGFAPSAIRMSGVVESYMLCILFVLAAFLAYLDLVLPDPAEISRRSRVAFAGYLSLALLSHYVAGLFFAACLAAPVLVALVRPGYRLALRRALPKRYAADAATILPPALVGGALFWFLARPWVKSLNHLPDFYFRPGAETPASFLVRNLANTFNLFSPVLVPGSAAAIVLLGAFTLVVFAAAVGERPPETNAATRAMPSAVLVLLLAIGMAAGLLGRYPFGGAMRHQLLFLVFGLLAAFVAFDRILARSSPGSRRFLAALCVVAIAVNTVRNAREWWLPTPDPFDAEVRTFHVKFPEAREVHVDQFNLIGFFAQYHDWRWTFLGRAAANPAAERYGVSRDEQRFTVVAHRDLWNIGLRKADLQEAIAALRRAANASCFEVFCVHQFLPGQPAPASEEEVRKRIAEAAADAGLRVTRLLVGGENLFAAFCVEGEPAQSPPRVGLGFPTQPDGTATISVLDERFRKASSF